MLNDGHNQYTWNAESEITTAAGVSYTYDGLGDRVAWSTGMVFWYGLGGEPLELTNASGDLIDDYIYFDGKRIAERDSIGNIFYYVEDHLGSSRVMMNSSGTVCYDADFLPFGQEVDYTDTCGSHYKFQGKERDTETGNDNFGARYYRSLVGRFLSPDWSAIPAPVPYANLTNPQTLNLYAMVSDNPETFADLDGHQSGMQAGNGSIGGSGPTGEGLPDCGTTGNPAINCATGIDFGPFYVLSLEAVEAALAAQQTQQQATQQHKATVIFGETSGLRSEVGKKVSVTPIPGADPHLTKARQNIADVSMRNSHVYSRTPTAAELRNPQVRAAWQASQAAAAASHGSLPGLYFFMTQKGVGPQRPPAGAGFGQGAPIETYGPFINVGGGSVPAGNQTYILFYNH